MKLEFATVILIYFSMQCYSHGDVISSDMNGSKEYCLDEEFSVRCLHNEVIQIKMALFGRMSTGRCIQDSKDAMFERNRNDPKFLGCYVDVMQQLDEKCSGKNSCEFKVNNNNILHQSVTKPCHESLREYLLADYSCITVVEPDRSCTVSVSSTPQHLMTSQSTTSNTKMTCGSRQNPWKLEALVGQQIKVSLLDFGGAVNQRDGDCLQYGYIIDRDASKNITMCGLRNERNRLIYHSDSNTLEVYLDDTNLRQSVSSKIFLELISTGCTDLVPPEGSWLRRRGSEAVVGCYSSRQTWHLNCVNNQWSGVIGNCTRESPVDVKESVVKAESSINNEVIVTLVIALCGLIVCMIVIICGVICIKRYRFTISRKKYNYDCHQDLITVQHNQSAPQPQLLI